MKKQYQLLFLVYKTTAKKHSAPTLSETNGVFHHDKASGITCILSGILLTCLFVFAASKDSEATIGGLLAGLGFGLFFSLVGIGFLLLNFKALFFIDKEHIKGKYRFFGKIDCSIRDVVFALGRNGTLIIQLKDGKTHTITQIENAWRLASVIRRNMPFDVSDPPKTLIEELNKLKSGRKKGILCVFFGLALMFINIFITVFLTGEREMHEFNKTDWTVFTFMCAIEIATVVATFYFAGKAGKNNIPIERLKYCIQRTVIESYPLLPGFVIAVYADEDYTARITLFGYPHDNAVYYSVQKLDAEYNPVHQYTSEVFENQEGLSEEFSSLIDITEKVLR